MAASSSGWRGWVASRTRRTTSASAMASRDFAMPRVSASSGGFAKACGINEFYGDAIEGDAFGDEVAGGAGGGGDDGAVAFDQAIEKGGLTGVGAAYDGEGEAVADDAAVGEGFFEGGERCLNFSDLRGDLGRGEEVDVVFGEVDAGFEGGDEGYKLLFYWGDLAGEAAA